ncbi:MAG: hypothetical protein V1790_12250, partial [Planctomycetota bacterium]
FYSGGRSVVAISSESLVRDAILSQIWNGVVMAIFWGLFCQCAQAVVDMKFLHQLVRSIREAECHDRRQEPS